MENYPKLRYNIKTLVAVNCYLSINSWISSSWLEVSTPLKCHKIELYYVAMEKKDCKKTYKKSVVKTASIEKQSGYKMFGITLTDKKIHIKLKELT